MRPIVAAKIHAGNRSLVTYALLDTGATSCAINRKLALDLGLDIREQYKTLYTFDKASHGVKEVTSFIVTDINENIRLEIINALVGDIMTTESEVPCPKNAIKQFDHMKDVDLYELDNPCVGLLISTQFSRHIFSDQIRKGPEDEPIAVLTGFGWSVVGPCSNIDEDIDGLHLDAICEDKNISIKDMIKFMYRHDFIAHPNEIYPSEMKHPSQADEYSLSQMKESVVFNQETGHYCVSVPWKHGREITAEQFRQVNFLSYARNRQRKLKEKLENDQNLLEGSFLQMEEQIELGHVRVIDNHYADPDSPVCYLANHIVTYEDKPGKFRITQDGAAKTKGMSLNSAVLTGPDFMMKLIGIVMRFRRHEVVLAADIKSFFFQIEIDAKDAPAGRHLWWTDRSMTKEIILEPRTFNMGLASSPSVSAFTLQYHAMQIKPMFDQAIFIAIMSQFYVDDYLDSVKTVEEGKKMKKGMIEALKLGGFALVKWRSNKEELNDEPTNTPASPPLPDSATDDAVVTEKEPRSNSDEIADENADENDDDDDDDDDDNDDNGKTPSPEEIKSALNQPLETGKLSDVTSPTVSSKILGIGYDFSTDNMFIKIGSKLNRPVLTKRQLLSYVSCMYDPIGIIAPFVLKGRLFFQKVNELKIGWNDPVPDIILKPFNRWKSSVPCLKSVQIPRWTSALGFEDSVSELIICTDASSIGYGIVCYIRRHLKGNNRAHVAFLMSKSHVVPLNMLRDPIEGQQSHNNSIPRLELTAAQLAAVWRDTIIREAGEDFSEVIIFSDSTTVLGWIGDWERKFATFENFRLKRIRLLSKVSEWQYISTKSNPADLASKGLNADDQRGWTFFHNGPPFLQQPRSDWETSNPQPAALQTSVENVGAIAAIAAIAPVALIAINGTDKEPQHTVDSNEEITDDWPTKCTANLSIWSSKVRRICIIKKTLLTLLEKVRAKKTEASLPRLRPRKNRNQNRNEKETEITTKQKIFLTLEEKSEGERLLIRALQKRHFNTEIVSLVKLDIRSPDAFNELKDKKSKLTSLSPFLDEMGLMRAGGRLSNSKIIPYESKFPIILPREDDDNVSSLFRHIHHKNYHPSSIQTFYLIRQLYFPLGGRVAVSKVISKCLPCQRIGKLPRQQRIADLPAERLDIVAPFCVTGVDVFGDFLTYQGRKSKKRWVLCCTCFTTRAVILLPLCDMTLSTTINALVKLNSQFPSLRKLVSDNGTNFRGANREIKEAIMAWNKDELNDRLTEIGVSWEFNPANSGHSGGVWERIIGLVKKSIRACIGDKKIDVDTFDTLCAGVSGVVNRRPLTHAGTELSDPMVLTPAHFLYPYLFTGTSTSTLPPLSASGDHLRTSWIETRLLLDDFFARFKREYLSTLLERRKWKTSTPNMKIGDVTLLVEDQLPRERWRICRVTEILSNDETRVRRVRVKDQNGTFFDRHVNKLVLLELE